jgi:hypothetical protein
MKETKEITRLNPPDLLVEGEQMPAIKANKQKKRTRMVCTIELKYKQQLVPLYGIRACLQLLVHRISRQLEQ